MAARVYAGYDVYQNGEPIREARKARCCQDHASCTGNHGVGAGEQFRNPTRSTLAFYCLFGVLAWLGYHRFDPQPFLSLGPIIVPPNQAITLCTKFILLISALFVGRIYLRSRGGKATAWDSFYAASISVSAAIGLYLLPYEVLNPLLGILIAAMLVYVAASTIYNSHFGLPHTPSDGRKQIAERLWKAFALIGFIACFAPSWSLCALSMEIDYPAVEADRRLANHIDAASRVLDEESWQTMSLEDRARFLSEILIVECNYLKVEDIPSLSVEARPDDCVASFDSSENKITFNPAYLMTREDGSLLVEAAAHEMGHRYQFECVQRGYALPANVSGWSNIAPMQSEIAQWKREFVNYVPSNIDANEYYEQEIEREAYAYGSASLAEIKWRVMKYKSTGNPEA